VVLLCTRLNPGKGPKRPASPARQLSWLHPTSTASRTPSAAGKPLALSSPRPHSRLQLEIVRIIRRPAEAERDNVIELKSVVRFCPAGGAKLVPLDLIRHAKRRANRRSKKLIMHYKAF
jgi:hypothetical protein